MFAMIDYHRIMDFSRPENARMINRLKVLSALRQKSASKAELADTLDINKVSVGEICRQLEKEGLIEASGKVRGASGRPGTILSISGKAGRVFSLTVSRKTASIAAASILAKVTRDRYMQKLHEEFPMYNWVKNAGYLTKEHLDAIDKFGLTKYHRPSFLRKHFEKINNIENRNKV